jgi:hypothetical protein
LQSLKTTLTEQICCGPMDSAKTKIRPRIEAKNA